VLNFLGGVVAIPLALTEYTYQSVREFKPIKTSLRFIGEVVQGTVVGAVVLAQNTGYVVKKVGGKMIRGTVKAGAFAVQGTGALLNLTGRVVTAPFRWIGFR
jgi:hypothetical protein